MKQINAVGASILVLVGGVGGTVARISILNILPPWHPIAVINILGSFFLGFITGISLIKSSLNKNFTLLLGTGFCGAFTTFSSFALELNCTHIAMINRLTYAIICLILGLSASLAGYGLSQLLKYHSVYDRDNTKRNTL